MIAYFDASAIVPLLIDEVGSEAAGQIWDRADRLVSVRLAQVETRAVLARAARIRPISPAQLRASVRALNDRFDQVDVVDLDEELSVRPAISPRTEVCARTTPSTSPPPAASPISTSSSWPVIGRCSRLRTPSACRSRSSAEPRTGRRPTGADAVRLPPRPPPHHDMRAGPKAVDAGGALVTSRVMGARASAPRLGLPSRSADVEASPTGDRDEVADLTS